MQSYDPNAPVILTDEEILSSTANKGNQPKSVRQLPVMRAACNLAFFIAQVESHIPRSLRAHSDQLELLTTQLITNIDLANEDRDARYSILTEAHAIVITIEIKFDILNRLGTFGGKDGKSIHYISNDENKKVKSLVKSVKSQIIGWRNSTK